MYFGKLRKDRAKDGFNGRRMHWRPCEQAREASSIYLREKESRDRFPIGKDLWEEGYFQYEALPLHFSDGSYKALTLATQSNDGFSSVQMELIKATLPALALVFEGFVARNAAKTLMETYVGKRAGLRVLDGEIARGDGSHIDAVIWFSDLRGFTSLAQKHDEAQILDLLNDYFGRVTDAVENQSGEVLKFIGDSLLAIFAHDGELSSAVARAESAAFEVLAGNRISHDYSFGIGLHPGKVFYGNIGGGTRLDFTVIGDAVNVASRIESLCPTLGQSLLASDEFVRNSKQSWIPMGRQTLKGVTEPIEVYAPKAMGDGAP